VPDHFLIFSVINTNYLAIKVAVRAGGVAQVEKHLFSKGEALSSNPSTTKKKKEME
jgi:hypothetical protein